MMTPSARRAADNTHGPSDERIRRQTEMNVLYYEAHPDQIDRRLAELNQEWDMARAVEANSSALTLAGLVLGIGVSRKWLLLALAVQGLFLHHALNGWSRPVSLLRRMGVRTRSEIEQERYALKVLRGDFQPVAKAPGAGKAGRATQVMAAVRG